MEFLLTLAAIVLTGLFYLLIESQQQFKKMKRKEKLPEIPGFRSVYPDEQIGFNEWTNYIYSSRFGSISKN